MPATVRIKIKTHLLCFFLLQNAGLLKSGFAEVPASAEVNYAEAVLNYNEKKFNQAIEIVEKLNRQYSDVSEFLELKALIFKAVHQDSRLKEIYEKIVHLKNKSSQDAQSVAPYFFELGLIDYQANRLDDAREKLSKSIEGGFNVPASHLFMGIVDFRRERWGDAKEHFEAVVESGMDDLRMAAHYYLGSIYIKMNSPGHSLESFHLARSLSDFYLGDKASNEETRKMAKQIFDGSDVALKPFDQKGLFGSISLLSGYDSNALAQGSGPLNSAFTPSGFATWKETLGMNLGIATSPLSSIQFVPSYHGSINLNSNPSTRNVEYFVHDLSLYLTKSPLAIISYGIKADGMYTFQDQPDVLGSRIFAGYSFQFGAGPYMRVELKPQWILSVEANMGPQVFFGDSLLSAQSSYLKRSGSNLNGRVSIKNERASSWWNPELSFIGDSNFTEGTEYNSRGVTGQFADTMYLSNRFTIVWAAGMGRVFYSRSPNPRRLDTIANVQLNASFKISSKFSLVLDGQYTVDLVDCDDPSVAIQYQYQRYQSSLGLSFRL